MAERYVPQLLGPHGRTRSSERDEVRGNLYGLGEIGQEDELTQIEQWLQEAEEAQQNPVMEQEPVSGPGEDQNLLETIGDFLLGSAAKTVNTGKAAAGGVYGLGRLAKESVFGDDASYEEALRGVSNTFDRDLRSGGLMESGTWFPGGNEEMQEMADEGTGEFARRTTGAGLQTAAEVVPLGRGYTAATRIAKGANKGRVIGQRALEGAAEGAVFEGGAQLAEGDFDPMQIALSGGAGAALGGAGGYVGSKFGEIGSKGSRLLDDSGRPVDEVMAGVDETVGRNADELLSDEPVSQGMLLDQGEGRIQRELDDINQQLEEIRGQASTFTPEPTTLDNAGVNPADELLGDTEFARNRRNGQVAVRRGTTATQTPGIYTSRGEEARRLVKQKRSLERQLERGALYDEANVTEGSVTQKAQAGDPAASKVVDDIAEDVDAYFKDVNDDYTPGILGGLKTFERMMEKAGLGKVMTKVREGFDNFARQERRELDRLQRWLTQEGIGKDSEVKIAKALDGKKVNLNAGEQRVFREMRKSYKEIAEQLGLPEEARISEYLPHIFEKGQQGKRLANAIRKLEEGNLTAKQRKKYENIIAEADPEVQRLIGRNSSGKISNKHRKRRTGAPGYMEDAFEVYRIYSKKAAMDANMSEGMDLLQKAKPRVHREMAEEINATMNSLKGMPEADASITRRVNDALEKAGFGPNAAARSSSAARAAIYRATLGFNTSSAIRNFTQNANTFGEIGSKWTTLGSKQAIENMSKRNLDEAVDMGILDDTFVDALKGREGTSLKGKFRKASQAGDKLLWAQFDGVEKFNRLTAYYGAKSKALAQNMTEKEAKEYAARISRKTQFKFSPMDTPRWFRGSMSKNLTQFMSFNVKQMEFLKDKFVSSEGMFQKVPDGKGYRLSLEGAWKLTRLIGANTAFYYTAGTAIGMSPDEMVPFLSEAKEGELPKSPITSIVFGDDYGLGLANIASGENQYGDPASRGEIAGEFFTEDLAPMLIPGGSQFNKTREGLEAANQGMSTTDAGNVRFLAEDDALQMGAFGQYSTSEAQDYIDRLDEGGRATLSDKQSEILQAVPEDKRQEFFDFFVASKGATGDRNEVYAKIREAKDAGNLNKAKRLADEWNAQLEDRFADVIETHPDMDDFLLEEMADFLINVDSVRLSRS